MTIHLKKYCKKNVSNLNNIYTFDRSTFGKVKYGKNGGDIYIIQTDLNFDNTYNIGRTTKIYNKLNDYRCNNVIEPRLYYYYPFKNIKKAENKLKNILVKYNLGKGVFNCDIEIIRTVILKLQKKLDSCQIECEPSIKHTKLSNCLHCLKTFRNKTDMFEHIKDCNNYKIFFIKNGNNEQTKSNNDNDSDSYSDSYNESDDFSIFSDSSEINISESDMKVSESDMKVNFRYQKRPFSCHSRDQKRSFSCHQNYSKDQKRSFSCHTDYSKNKKKNLKNLKNSKNENFICKFCNKFFNYKSNLYRHQKHYCNEKNNYEELDIKDKKIKELEEQVDKLKRSQHVTYNNNITLIAHNKSPDLSHLTDNDYLKIMNRGFSSVPKLIEAIHFNPEKPENQNVYIPNMKNKYAMTWDGRKWNLSNTENVIDDLYDDNSNILIDKLEKLEELDPNCKVVRKFKRFLEKKEDDLIMNKVKDDIKLLLFNSKNVIQINTK